MVASLSLHLRLCAAQLAAWPAAPPTGRSSIPSSVNVCQVSVLIGATSSAYYHNNKSWAKIILYSLAPRAGHEALRPRRPSRRGPKAAAKAALLADTHTRAPPSKRAACWFGLLRARALIDRHESGPKLASLPKAALLEPPAAGGYLPRVLVAKFVYFWR